MMLTEQEGFRNNDRAYNDNRNFEKSREIQVLDQVHLMKDQEIMEVLKFRF